MPPSNEPKLEVDELGAMLGAGAGFAFGLAAARFLAAAGFFAALFFFAGPRLAFAFFRAGAAFFVFFALLLDVLALDLVLVFLFFAFAMVFLLLV
jgi:hypothetical protein